jgi:Protein of unknown function (DUF3572)
MTNKQEIAETLAIEALTWLVGQEDLLGLFLGASGLAPAELRGRAGDPDFLASVLDFILTDDAWVRRFCDGAGRAYDAPMRARQALPGGEPPHWT